MLELLTWTKEAWSDYVYWQTQDRKTIKRINKLIIDTQRSPFSGIGKPEPLKENLSEFWSRRIDDTNRLVYAVDDNCLTIISCNDCDQIIIPFSLVAVMLLTLNNEIFAFFSYSSIKFIVKDSMYMSETKTRASGANEICSIFQRGIEAKPAKIPLMRKLYKCVLNELLLVLLDLF